MRFLVVFFFFAPFFVRAQEICRFADSVRKAYDIPELAFAVVSADSVMVMHISGVRKINSDWIAGYTDRFHIGSNTKAITSFIAALLVTDKKIKWGTHFFDVFPELKKNSRKEYRNITFQDLLTFRGMLPSYTYTFAKPDVKEIRGTQEEQRLRLAEYFLTQKPMRPVNGLTASNADYILAGLMLERAAGKSYKDLVRDFGAKQNIAFGFDYPNLNDTSQVWGHDAELHPLPPMDNPKLNWLLSAGNINVTLPDYCRFIQLQLKGLKGNIKIIPAAMFAKLLFGFPGFSFGWFNTFDKFSGSRQAYNTGNAGAFITQVRIISEKGIGYVVFTNAAAERTALGVEVLMAKLLTEY